VVEATGEAGLRAAVEAWIADDPDAGDRAELRALLDRADAGAELRDRFAGRLRFGTAGLRGAVAAGPNRMNRAVVRAATAAVAGWLLESGRLGAAAGVMITASHNPAADNGYKLYLSDGAQVIPPADTEIEKRIAGLGPLARIPVAEAASPLITRHGDEVAQAYLDAVAGPEARRPAGPALRVVYTPMHGVAGDLMLRAIRQAGFAAPHVVAA
jgi:phosphomannomutase